MECLDRKREKIRLRSHDTIARRRASTFVAQLTAWISTAFLYTIFNAFVDCMFLCNLARSKMLSIQLLKLVHAYLMSYEADIYRKEFYVGSTNMRQLPVPVIIVVFCTGCNQSTSECAFISSLNT